MADTATTTFNEALASDATRFLRVLAHPKRLLLLTILSERQLSARRLGHAVGLSRATVFKHLNQLVEIGLLPRSEKHVDRVFNEAEQVADEDDADGDVVDLPDTGLPAVEGTTGKKRGRRPLPENLPRERVGYDLPDDQKVCPCCADRMHRPTCASSH
ncbi:hypothetical protein C6558_38565 [Ensifer sp. NM-2]|nr:hypothetical protein C6558_38565 [Ensifer sp. NM-2]